MIDKESVARPQIDAVGLITTGRLGFSETFRNVYLVQNNIDIKYGIQHFIINPYWGQSLTHLITRHIDSGAEYFVFFDGDGGFTPQDLYDLHRVIEEDPRIDAIWPVQSDRKGSRPLVFDWNPSVFGPYDYDRPFMKYPHGHFGLTLIRTRVFRQMPQPWFWDQPATDGTWEQKEGKMDADTYFWLKLLDVQKKTGNYCIQANATVIGHMQLMMRWQDGAKVICQSLDDYYANGKPYGLHMPRPEDYEHRGHSERAAQSAYIPGETTGSRPFPYPRQLHPSDLGEGEGGAAAA